MPETRLILHVKGTEADTAELPAHVVREAISQGQITHSQLIWSPMDNAWKQVRDLPHLLPVERLIIHVKGTEAETKELPKQAVRVAISQGEMTHSQLIWSPVHNAWKQAREFPDLLPGEHLILHVKGTEAGTAELPKRAIRAGISKGDITHSQLIWSPADNAWKQVRELPDLLPSQKLAPAPARVPVAHVPVAAVVPDSPTSPVARVAVRASQGAPQVRVAASATPATTGQVGVAKASPVATPQVRAVQATPAATGQVNAAKATPAATPQVRAAQATPAATGQVRVAKASPTATPQVRAERVSTKTPEFQPAVPATTSFVVKEAAEFHPLKWLCIGLGALILIVLGGNYLLVDQPLVSGMGQTPYSNVRVYAHLGAFVQPNVMVIHLPASPALTRDNLTDFLVTLSRNTPQNPVSHNLFDRVALTSGWISHYSMSGIGWRQLGDSDHETPAQIKEDLLNQLSDSGGEPLLAASSLNEEAQQAERDKVWDQFANYFTAKQ